jgi:hypothetical protein
MSSARSHRAVRVPWPLLAAVLAAACAGRPGVTDTGYEGTWTRGNDRIRSTLSIVRRGGRYATRLSVRSADGTYAIRGGWDGRAEEMQDGAKTHDLEFRTTADPATGHLIVECTGTPRAPSGKPYRYVDELVVEPGGLALSAYTVERDGQRHEGEARPRREYLKASDEVRDPPGAAGAP